MHKKIKDFQLSEIPYREIVEGISDIVFALDIEGRFIYVGPSIENYLGYTPPELIGKYTWEFVAPDDHTKARERALDIVHATLPTTEYRIRAKNGAYRWFRSVSKLLYENNELIGRYGILNDITEQKKAELTLIENEIKYKNIFNNLVDTYVETSLDGTILEISPSCESLFGYTREEVLGTSGIMHYVNSEDRDRHVKELLSAGQTSNYNLELYDKNGSIVPVSLSSKLIKDNQGHEYIISMVRNERERKKTELALRQSENRLRQAEKMESIGNLAGGIAHDFNNILTSIIGFTELALDEVKKETSLDDSLQEVYKAANRAKDLVKQILVFARQSKEELQPIQPGLIIKEVLQFIRSTIPTTIKIRQALESDALIMGNTTQLHQVLMNLCTNAAHAMENQGGILEVSLKDVTVDKIFRINKSSLKHNDYIEVMVSDTGEGIAPDIIDSIFEPYFTTKGPGKGTGMGLAMVQGIVKTYGGHISVDSNIGKGTLFTLYFPITRKHKAQRGYVQKELPKGTERVLFVDDEVSIAKIGGQVLERLGYAITTCNSSVEALELVSSRPDAFDLVVTDMTMPNITGDQLAIELLKIRPDIPIILCTGFSNKVSEETALKIGIKAFAYKPIVKADLARTVRKVLDETKVNEKSNPAEVP